MTAQYAVHLYTPAGSPYRMNLRFTELDYTMRVNDRGYIAVSARADELTTLARSQLACDYRIVVWRKPDGSSRWLLDFAGFIRLMRLRHSGQELFIDLEGYHYNELLARRIVDAYAGSSEASKNTYADDMIKAVVREQLGSLATDSLRDLSDLGFTVEADLSAGTVVRKAFARQNVLSVCQDIAEASRSTPATAVYFGFVPTEDGTTAELRTRVGQWGMDVSELVTFGLEFGNAKNVEYVDDRRDEITYVYSVGAGVGINRIKGTDQSDSERIAESPYNRREALYEYSSQSSATYLSSQARALLDDGRPRRRLTFDIQDTAATRLGVHYDLGYAVRGEFAGIASTYHVAGVRKQVREGRETLTVALEEL